MPAAPPNRDLFTQETVSRYTQSALYGNGRYYFTPKFDLSFGGRATHDETSATDVLGGLFGGGNFQLRQSSRFASFMLAPRYRLDRAPTLYARAASASRPGGPNSLTPAGIAAGASQTFGPDKLISYELGVKTTAGGGRLGADLSLFHIDWRDIQVRSTVGTFAFIANGGKARSQGMELSLTARPVDALSLTMNGAYTDATLSDAAPGVGGLPGERLPNSARLSAAFGADYLLSSRGAAQPYVGGSLRYLGERLENFVRSHSRDRLALPGYATLDLHAGIRWDRCDLNFYVKNATDKHYIETVTTNFSPVAAAVGRPRTVGMFATMRFE